MGVREDGAMAEPSVGMSGGSRLPRPFACAPGVRLSKSQIVGFSRPSANAPHSVRLRSRLPGCERTPGSKPLRAGGAFRVATDFDPTPAERSPQGGGGSGRRRSAVLSPRRRVTGGKSLCNGAGFGANTAAPLVPVRVRVKREPVPPARTGRYRSMLPAGETARDCAGGFRDVDQFSHRQSAIGSSVLKRLVEIFGAGAGYASPRRAEAGFSRALRGSSR